MANNIAATLLILALALPDAAFAEWSNKEGVVEPPKEMTLGWRVNEIPSNVTVYYDVNGDKQPDVVFAHPIVFVNTGVYCDVKRTVDEQYWMFSTCPADHAADYFVTRQWALYKFIGGGWQRVYEYVDKHERDRTCGIRQNKQSTGNQNFRRAEESCTGD
jgi:hypothetical protein